MKTFYAIFLALLISGLAAAQSGVDEQIESKRKELRLVGVDTTIVYYCYSNGGVLTPILQGDTSCHIYNIKYLIWNQTAQTFVQRFDNCGQHHPMAVSSSFIRTIKNNYKKLVTEKVLPPEYTYWKKGNKISITQSISHSTFTVFEINAGAKSIRKSIDHADLGVRYLDGKHTNINYLHNLNSIQNKLKLQAEAIVKKLYGH